MFEVPSQDPVIATHDVEWTLEIEEIDWQNDDMLDLPGELDTYVINSNDAEQRIDFLVRFPPGYIEPRHTHAAAHADLILDGEMHVHDEVLTSGDYIYGQKLSHGPMEFPDGCIVFCSYTGGSPSHEWDGDEDRVGNDALDG